MKSDSLTYSITIVNDTVNIKIADQGNLPATDLFTVKRTRVPNREASFQFHHSNIHSRKIGGHLTKMPSSQNHFWRYANARLQSLEEQKQNTYTNI